MKDQEFIEILNSGEEIIAGSDTHLHMGKLAQRAQKLTSKFNSEHMEHQRFLAFFAELTSRVVPESLRIFPPFQTECGLNIHVGEQVFINSGCRFQDHGGIYLGDGALIGHNCVLATLNHNMNPAKRANMIPAPIHIGKSVWIGANSTIVPGITIGDGAIIGAGSVVTRDVPANQVYAGVPARFIKDVPLT